MAKYWKVSKEVRDEVHDVDQTGWAEIAKFGSFDKAQKFVAKREKANAWLYANNNPDRHYHLIELDSQ